MLKTIRLIAINIGLSMLLLLSCERETVLPECKPQPTNWSPSRTQVLFFDLTFDQEFGQASDRLRKWNSPIKIFLEGNASSEILEEINQVIKELNQLSSSLSIEIIANPEVANLRLFLGEKEDYVALVEPQAAGIAEGNSGFATIAWNNDFEIIRASVCLDVINYPDLMLQQHIIREELAQTLGLINDTELEDTSIFHQFLSSTKSYNELDRIMIQYMLGSELRPGMCPNEVWEIVE